MKKITGTLLIVLSVIAMSFAGTVTIKVSTEADAQIYVNGTLVSSGKTEIKVAKNSTVNVKVKKAGYLTEERNYKNDGVMKLPKSEFISLTKDPSYESSTTTDIANKDIDIKTDKLEDEAWKLLSQIVTSNFDVIDVTDKNSGYMRTAWVVKRFGVVTVRTRLIIKMGNSNPLLYKVKLISERSEQEGASPKDDEKFSEWDRLLRAYENIINEMQSRLSK